MVSQGREPLERELATESPEGAKDYRPFGTEPGDRAVVQGLSPLANDGCPSGAKRRGVNPSHRGVRASRPQPENPAGETPALLSVLVPVYNEAKTVTMVLKRVLALGPIVREIIVVDDGSTDSSAALVAALAAAEPRIRLLRRARNRGKTAAVRLALKHARGDIILIQDADLEYAPADIPAVIAPIVAGQTDVVYGSRFLTAPKHAVHRTRYLAHYLANVGLTQLSNLLTGRRLTDIETGYKAFRAGVIKPLRLNSRGFGLEVEITALISRTKARTCEVPISYCGRGYRDGKKIGLLDGVMAGFYILWFNLGHPWLASARHYRQTVNAYLGQDEAPALPAIAVPHAA